MKPSNTTIPTPRAGILALALWLLSGAALAHHEPESGMYFDPARNGHGLDLHRAGEVWFLLFYTYEPDGSPIWYLAAAPMADGRLETDLLQFRYDTAASPPQQVDAVVGTVALDFGAAAKAACAGKTAQASFDWTINGQTGQWCVQRLVAAAGEPAPGRDWSGNWFAGAEDEGWGLSVHYQGAESLLEFLLIYFYDATGFPRWGLGVNPDSGPDAEITAEITIEKFTGYCRSCDAVPLTTATMGTVSHTFSITEARKPGARFDVDLEYPGVEGGSWQRSGSTGELLSETAPRLVPLPDAVDQSTPIAIVDVTVVPMAGEKTLLHHQNVLIADGGITEVGPRAQVNVPNDAVRIDGRTLYLGPGLSEMHLHISFGGQSAAEESGLLFLANGVTTVLNMGDGFNVDVPGLGEKFESGELMGPSFYAGQVAYGTSDNAGPANTVATPAAASSFSEQIAGAGYDYIKVYWGITPDTMDRFAVTSQQLGLPIIGHLPLTQGIRANFEDGQIMAAHAQEPWISFLNQQFLDSQLPAAAEHFLDFGAYLTPTLAVFESWTSVYGGDVDAFNDLVQREGVMYTPPNIRSAWLNYFNSTNVQGAGQVIDALDPMFEFFLRLTRAFHEEGVPLLVGTDAPGFPGVMSGFGAHREMELFELAGLAPADIYRAASTNAGSFVAETLGGQPFGTVTVGHRADLILTTASPLEAVENLRRPHAVIARGRFWSQAYLQAQLNTLAESQKDAGAGKYPAAGLPFCADHLAAPARERGFHASH